MSESMVCCPLSSDCDSQASCYSQTTRTARKAHRCYECNEVIDKGSRYEHISGIWDKEPNSYKTCVSCVEIRDHFACGNGWLFGQLWEDLQSNFFSGMKAGGPCMAGLSPKAKARTTSLIRIIGTSESKGKISSDGASVGSSYDPKPY